MKPSRHGVRSAWGLVVLLCLSNQTNAGERYSLRTASEAGVEYVFLSDDVAGIEAAVAPFKGGELSGLRVRLQGEWLELLYRARDYQEQAGWRGKAPILWPAVGRNFSRSQPPDKSTDKCSYDYNGRRFEIPLHGFARFHSWRVIERQATETGAWVKLELADNESTRALYPFGFTFGLTYRIEAGRLTLEHSVRASEGNAETLFFSIGNHVTLRIPLVPGSTVVAMSLQTPSRVEYLKDENTIPTGETRPQNLSASRPLAALSYMPPIALGGYGERAALTLADEAGIAITIEHESSRNPTTPFTQFNLWGDPAQGYFSPEPWVGMINSLNRREGLIELQPGEDWSWVISLQIDRNQREFPSSSVLSTDRP